MSGEPVLPPLKPIPIKDRISVAYIEKGNLDVLDSAFVVVDKNGIRTHIPVGGLVYMFPADTGMNRNTGCFWMSRGDEPVIRACDVFCLQKLF